MHDSPCVLCVLLCCKHLFVSVCDVCVVQWCGVFLCVCVRVCVRVFVYMFACVGGGGVCRVSTFAGLDHWTGLLDWTTGLPLFYAKAYL